MHMWDSCWPVVDAALRFGAAIRVGQPLDNTKLCRDFHNVTACHNSMSQQHVTMLLNRRCASAIILHADLPAGLQGAAGHLNGALTGARHTEAGRQASALRLKGKLIGTWNRPERSPPYSNHLSRGTVMVECTSPTDG